MASTLLQFTPLGLVFDVFGVILLGFAFFFKSKEAIIQEAGTYWDSNPHVLRNVTSSKFDGLFGSLLLLIGFIFQMLGYIGCHSENLAKYSYILLAGFVIVYFIILRKWLVNRWVKSLNALIQSTYP